MPNDLTASRFFADLLTHVKGEKAGEPFALLQWQVDLIDEVFGTKRPDGFRRYDTVYIEVPRKNGKTTLAAGIALYMLVGDGEAGAEVYSLAATREQARLVFRTATQMVRQSPVLMNLCELYKDTIVVPKTFSRYKVLSAEAGHEWGHDPTCVIFDELHAQPNRELWDSMVTAVASRRQPLTVALTTAGTQQDRAKGSICWEQHETAIKVRDGIFDDPGFLPVIYAAGDDEDWTDPKVWAKANPSLGETVRMDFLERECKRAQENLEKENAFRRLHLNQWTQQEVRWISLEQWDKCSEPFSESDLEGKTCYAGLDLASTRDLTALSLVFPIDEVFYVLPYFWVPEKGAGARQRRDRVPYEMWRQQGHIEYTTGGTGETTDYAAVRRKVHKLSELFDLHEIAYDPYNAMQLVNQLSEDGFEMYKFSQGWQKMSPACKDFDKTMFDEKIRHNGHPILRWNASNVDIISDAAGNIKPVKPDGKDPHKIDGIVATVMGLARAMENWEVGSAYDEGDLLVV